MGEHIKAKLSKHNYFVIGWIGTLFVDYGRIVREVYTWKNGQLSKMKKMGRSKAR